MSARRLPTDHDAALAGDEAYMREQSGAGDIVIAAVAEAGADTWKRAIGARGGEAILASAVGTIELVECRNVAGDRVWADALVRPGEDPVDVGRLAEVLGIGTGRKVRVLVIEAGDDD